MNQPVPNFFIVGAPRCGTTALCHYLGRHPEVFVSAVKEMHHFGEVWNRPEYKDRSRYLAEFADAEGKKRVGEASVWYLYSHLAPAEIKAFNPDARVIIMLRNPADMVVSLHQKLLLIGPETETDFARALALEPGRRAAARLADGSVPLRPVFYTEVGKYAGPVGRWLGEFGPGRALVVIFDDFRRDPAGQFRRALEFLEVDPDFSPGFEKVNENRRVRSLALHHFLRHAPGFLWTLRRKLLPADFHPGRFLYNWNAPPAKAPVLDQQLRAQLIREFAPDVLRLGQILGRGLEEWSK